MCKSRKMLGGGGILSNTYRICVIKKQQKTKINLYLLQIILLQEIVQTKFYILVRTKEKR